MGTDALRAPLDQVSIDQKISQYWRVKVVDVTESTQDDIAVSATLGEAHHGDVVVAEYQSKGRGRLDRTFEAASGASLTFSFFIKPMRENSYWSFLPLLSGIAVHRALESLDPNILTSIKWPNDLLIGDKKIAGIIAQTSGPGVVIGIGLNVGMTRDELPVPHASSLKLNGYAQLNRNLILAEILNQFELVFKEWDLGRDFVDEYMSLSSTIGVEIEAQLPGGVIHSGVAEKVDHHGALILGSGTVITAGEIVHLR